MDNKELIKIWKERDVSWSQLSSWYYNKSQWANKYLLGLSEEGNQGMRFGNTVGDTLGTPNSMVPALEPFLVGKKEYKMRAKMNDIYLIGYADHYCPEKNVLNENKTSQNINRWNQKEVDGHDQLTMYALMLFLDQKVKPETIEMWLNFIPVHEGGDFQLTVTDPNKFQRFPTSRTTMQCLIFATKIDKTLKEMEKYALSLDLPA